ncbi:MAG: hypothetical protein KAG94_01535 [Clostridiales bacterium]|nr:hypothetical protein [Clostridiales bacterium]
MNSKQKHPIYLIMASLMTFAVSLASIQYTDLDFKEVIGIVPILLLSFAFSYICKPIFKNIKSLLLSLGILLSTGSFFYFINLYNTTEKAESTFLSGFFTFLQTFVFDWTVGLDKPPEFQRIIIIGLIFLLSIIMHLSIYRFKATFIAIVLSTSIFTAQWAFIHEVQKLAFYVYLPTVFLLYVFFIHSLKNPLFSEDTKTNEQQLNTLFKITVPLILLSLFIMFLLPINRGAIQVPWLDKIIKEKKYITHVIKYDFFSLANSGFSTSSSELNSKVRLNTTVVLNIYGEKPMYLKGAVYDIYTGKRWLRSEDDLALAYSDTSNERIQALDELFYGTKLLFIPVYNDMTGYDQFYNTPTILKSLLETKRLPNYNLNNFLFESKVMTLIYKDLQTQAMFTPPFSRLVNSSQTENILINKDEVFTNEELLVNGQKFSLEYLNIDLTNDLTQLIINYSYEGFYYDISQYLDNYMTFLSLKYNEELDTMLTYDAFEPHYLYYKNKLTSLMEQAQYNIINYTSLPTNISNRTIQLAYSLTKDATNNYEKVKNIEAYFKYGFTYTLNPMTLPSQDEFVDFFLFESKEGYCSSFATAMTVMVRSIGLPARYVEGYVMPSKTIDDNLYEVKNSNAHSWVEVYFEGVGWINFEPTFAFSYTQDGFFEGDSTIDGSLFSTNRYAKYLENLGDEDYLDLYDPTIDETDMDSTQDEYTISTLDKEKTSHFNYLILLYGSLLILFLAYLIIRISRWYLYSHIKNNKRFINRYQHILQTLKQLKYSKLPHQTLREYAIIIDEIFSFNDMTFSDLTVIYYKIIYSNHSVSAKECESFSLFYRDYIKVLKDDVDFLEYLIKRHLFPLI